MRDGKILPQPASFIGDALIGNPVISVGSAADVGCALRAAV
jgi:hypothetical protein